MGVRGDRDVNILSNRICRGGRGIDTTRLLASVVVALLAGLVPAMKAYKTPVATNLVAV